MASIEHDANRASTPAPKTTVINWCRWCGDTLAIVKGRYPHFCGLECAEMYRADAKRRRAPQWERERLRTVVYQYRRKARECGQ